ncbi:phage holin family protein [Mesonia sp. MT50]|uniref:Phage holin family protein n=1 Tax=Mesonia profundi TaxID=3070998 RepID=A0ABU0ZYR5_9FLAO|nr:phage holin family protein [Mesonia profundi]MDQ7916514.1 phage holin family protein [Mesonia profundi]
MSINNLTNHIDELNSNAQAYIESTLEYYKLDVFKKATKTSAAVARFLVVGSIFLLFLAFISVGFSILIGKSLGSLSYGFFIVGGVYFLLFLLVLIFGKAFFSKLLLKKMSKSAFNDSGDEDESLEEELYNN